MSAACLQYSSAHQSQAAYEPRKVEGDDVPKKAIPILKKVGPKPGTKRPDNTSGLPGIRFQRIESGNPPVWKYRVLCNIKGTDGKASGRTSFSGAMYGNEGALLKALICRTDNGFPEIPVAVALEALQSFLQREAELFKVRLEQAEAEGKPHVLPRRPRKRPGL